MLVEVSSLSKKYCRDLRRSLVYGTHDIFRELAGRRPKTKLRPSEFWALRNINFSMKPGETLGLIGPNGSGKTTLLRTMCGLIKPSSGFIKIHGRIAPLIALGAGFNPVLSGRENIYVNLAILGVPKARIDKIFNSIVDFSEVGYAIDAPVRTYSSGMAARLGFACAIHTEPDILFVDEVLAVGDARFRMKCYRKLAEMRQNGVSLILVSHNSNAILSVCERALYLKKGEAVFLGPSAEAMQLYQADLDSIDDQQNLQVDQTSRKSSAAKIKSLYFCDDEGKKLATLNSGQSINLNVEFETQTALDNLSMNVIIRDQLADRSDLLAFNSATDNFTFTAQPGINRIRIKMPVFCLKSGKYLCKVNLVQGEFFNVLDIFEAYRFTVQSHLNLGSSRFYQPRSWSVEI